MKIKFVIAFVLVAPVVGTAGANTPCKQLWSLQPSLRQEEVPIWVVPAVPSEGLVSGLKMFALVRPDGSRFVPRDVRESNCYLDRALDATIREAIQTGAMYAAKVEPRGSEGMTDAFLDKSAAKLGQMLGSEESGMAIFLSVLANLQNLYSLDPTFDPERSPFRKHANQLGLYGEHTITWYVLLSYAEHLGVRGLRVHDYVRHHQK